MPSTQRLLTLLAGLTLFIALANSVRADDQIDNPRYKAWASFKEGSSATLVGTTNVGPMQVTTETKWTLKEVKDDHVTVEVKMTATVNGQSHEAQPSTQTIPAKIDPKDMKAGDDEDVEAMGKTFKCKVFTGTYQPPAQADHAPPAGEAKFWANAAVPGGLVKFELKTRMPGSNAEVTRTSLLKDFEAK